MSLRKTVIFAIVITFIGLFVILIVNLRTILSDYFYLQERNSILFDLQRSQAALNSDIDSLQILVTDWLSGKENANPSRLNPEDLKLDLTTTSLVSLRIAFAAALDLNGNALFVVPPSAGQAEILQPENLARFAAQPNQPMSGVYVGRASTHIVTRRVIKDAQGLNTAILLFGRLIDPAQVLSGPLASGFQARLLLLQDDAVPQDVAAGFSRTSANPQPNIQIQDQDVINGYALQKNVFGQPVIVLKLTEARNVYRNGQLMISYLILFLVLSSIIFAIIILLLMERLIVARLLKLSVEVNQITRAGNASGRVSVTRQDELSRLSVNINSLLTSMEATAHEQQTSLVALGRLEQDLRDQVKRLETLHEISRSFLPQSDSLITMTEITRLSVDKLGLEAAVLVSARPHPALPKIIASHGSVTFQPDDPVLVKLVNQFWQKRASFVSSEILPHHSASIQPLYETESEVYLFIILSAEADRPEVQKQLLQAFFNLAEIKLQSAFLFEAVRNGREALAVLSHRLVEIQEEERRWIAQELHDEIGQILTGLKLTIDATTHQSPGQIEETLANAQTIVNDLIARIRQISLDLRPPMLDDLGLLPSLVWLFERYQQQTGIEIDFSHYNIEGLRFHTEQETAVYRVIQEALTNVARHARTDRVIIQLWSDETSINARIEDRGEGFDLSSVLNSPKTRGLLGIRERISFLRGKLSIDTSPGQGTSLTIELPSKPPPLPPKDGHDH